MDDFSITDQRLTSALDQLSRRQSDLGGLTAAPMEDPSDPCCCRQQIQPRGILLSRARGDRADFPEYLVRWVPLRHAPDAPSRSLRFVCQFRSPWSYAARPLSRRAAPRFCSPPFRVDVGRCPWAAALPSKVPSMGDRFMFSCTHFAHAKGRVTG